MTDQPGSGGHARPLTYDDAESVYRSSLLAAGRERYAELADRDLSASTTARLRERGEFDPANPGHQAIAANQPLSADEHLERIAIGEALARYYRHPAMVDDAAKAGASWEQIGAARGASARQQPAARPIRSGGRQCTAVYQHGSALLRSMCRSRSLGSGLRP
jgi:hypothetical protein